MTNITVEDTKPRFSNRYYPTEFGCDSRNRLISLIFGISPRRRAGHDDEGDSSSNRQGIIRVTPRPRGSAAASGVLPLISMAWMSPLKSCPFNT
jgi:hypothetical protein